MKRIIAVLILFVFITTSYFIGVAYIKSSCKQANDLLEDCTRIYNLDQDATKASKELADFWTKTEPCLSLFANHAQIDEIELAISSLQNYANSKDNAIFYEYSGTVKTLLHQMVEDNTPSLHSIF